MEPPPAKRPRLSDRNPAPHRRSAKDNDHEGQDELFQEPGQVNLERDPGYQLELGRAKSAFRLKSTFESIFAKYNQDLGGDEIDLRTGEIIVDNGHIVSLDDQDENASEDEEEDSPEIPNPAHLPGHTGFFPPPFPAPPQAHPFGTSYSPFAPPPPPPAVDPTWQPPDLPAGSFDRPVTWGGGVSSRPFGSTFGRQPQVLKTVSRKDIMPALSGETDDDDILVSSQTSPGAGKRGGTHQASDANRVKGNKHRDGDGDGNEIKDTRSVSKSPVVPRASSTSTPKATSRKSKSTERRKNSRHDPQAVPSPPSAVKPSSSQAGCSLPLADHAQEPITKKRPRGRPRKQNAQEILSLSDKPYRSTVRESLAPANSGQEPAKEKRPRGRPRKHPLKPSPSQLDQPETSTIRDNPPPADDEQKPVEGKRPRGRPRKQPVQPSSSQLDKPQRFAVGESLPPGDDEREPAKEKRPRGRPRKQHTQGNKTGWGIVVELPAMACTSGHISESSEAGSTQWISQASKLPMISTPQPPILVPESLVAASSQRHTRPSGKLAIPDSQDSTPVSSSQPTRQEALEAFTTGSIPTTVGDSISKAMPDVPRSLPIMRRAQIDPSYDFSDEDEPPQLPEKPPPVPKALPKPRTGSTSKTLSIQTPPTSDILEFSVEKPYDRPQVAGQSRLERNRSATKKDNVNVQGKGTEILVDQPSNKRKRSPEKNVQAQERAQEVVGLHDTLELRPRTSTRPGRTSNALHSPPPANPEAPAEPEQSTNLQEADKEEGLSVIVHQETGKRLNSQPRRSLRDNKSISFTQPQPDIVLPKVLVPLNAVIPNSNEYVHSFSVKDASVTRSIAVVHGEPPRSPSPTSTYQTPEPDSTDEDGQQEQDEELQTTLLPAVPQLDIPVRKAKEQKQVPSLSPTIPDLDFPACKDQEEQEPCLPPPAAELVLPLRNIRVLKRKTISSYIREADKGPPSSPSRQSPGIRPRAHSPAARQYYPSHSDSQHNDDSHHTPHTTNRKTSTNPEIHGGYDDDGDDELSVLLFPPSSFSSPRDSSFFSALASSTLLSPYPRGKRRSGAFRVPLGTNSPRRRSRVGDAGGGGYGSSSPLSHRNSKRRGGVKGRGRGLREALFSSPRRGLRQGEVGFVGGADGEVGGGNGEVGTGAGGYAGSDGHDAGGGRGYGGDVPATPSDRADNMERRTSVALTPTLVSSPAARSKVKQRCGVGGFVCGQDWCFSCLR